MDEMLQQLPGMDKGDLEQNMDELLDAVDDDKKAEEEEDEELNEALLSKYPMFLTDEEGTHKCIFVYLHKELSSQIESHGYTQQQHCVTAPPKLNGPTLDWDKSLLEQNVGPETFLNVLPNHAILISIRCAYFADNQPLMIPVCSAWQMMQVKKSFLSECKLDLFDNIKEDDSKLSEDKLHIFQVNNINLVTENNVIDKTVGNGLEPYKNASRLLYEEIGDLDVLLIVPNLILKSVSFIKKNYINMN